MFSPYFMQPDGWGYYSDPEVAAEHLQLDLHLDWVPENGVVYDIGSGSACPLGAAIFLRRPDITVVNVDPGYRIEPPCAIDESIVYYSGTLRQKLHRNDSWHTNRLANFADEISAPSESADMIVSYAALPEHVVPIDAAAKEMLRLLKVGGVALLGPMNEWVGPEWEETLEIPEVAAKIDQHSFETREVTFPHRDEPFTVSFSTVYT